MIAAVAAWPGRLGCGPSAPRQRPLQTPPKLQAALRDFFVQLSAPQVVAMAPVKPQKSKSGSTSSSAKGAKPSKHSKPKTHTSIGTAKVDPKKKKKRTYTEEELGIPKLNMITPVGVQKPKGKKKGKVFVDDQVCVLSPLPNAPLPPFP